MNENPKIANQIMTIGALWKELWEQYGKQWDDPKKKEEFIKSILQKIRKEADEIELDLQK